MINGRLTKKRDALSNCIRSSGMPISAPQIVEIMKQQMDQATVYRGLQFLENNGIIESFLFECSSEGILKYYTYRSDEHRHYFHCERCHRFIPVEICNARSIEAIEKEHKVEITSHTVCYRGICGECAALKKA